MITETPIKVVPVITEQDVILARQDCRALAQRLGFSAVDQARITTAVSELARNIVVYGVRGNVTLVELLDGDRKGVQISFDDEGPGIADVDTAMQQGYTSGKGLGAGLPGSQRLMDEFTLETAPGQGVHIRVRKWR
ncbi:MAG: putative anti-sigma regulatory factor, serine/threonine protein kinase [Cyanobacteria bacterium RYN_339]|nr:putative anti-sigma regulatory factor, serine/threonine protein kinase [Cyanobacteria bacterium RYN_339]